MSTRYLLAKVIFDMPYGVLRDVANDFAEMVSDEDVRLEMKTREDFSSLLYDWAEANAPSDAQEQSKVKVVK